MIVKSGQGPIGCMVKTTMSRPNKDIVLDFNGNDVEDVHRIDVAVVSSSGFVDGLLGGQSGLEVPLLERVLGDSDAATLLWPKEPRLKVGLR